MKKFKILLVAALFTLTACLGTGLDTAAKRGVAFCNTYIGALTMLTQMRQVGQLSTATINQVQTAVTIIQPYCSGATPLAPSASAESALETLIALQLGEAL